MGENRPFILGLTGGIACGKTTVAKHLERLGAVHVDADEVSRALTAPGGKALAEIRRVFGDGVFHADGALDRRALGAVVFSDAAQKRALEAILHPMIQHEMVERVDSAAAAGEKVCVLNVPLLFETAMDVMCDAVWVVTMPEEKEIVRLMNRDSLSRPDAIARIRSQMPLAEKEARATLVFHTDRPEQETLREVEHRYKELLRSLR